MITTSSDISDTPKEQSIDYERVSDLEADDIVIFYENKHERHLKKEKIQEKREKLKLTYKGNRFS